MVGGGLPGGTFAQSGRPDAGIPGQRRPRGALSLSAVPEAPNTQRIAAGTGNPWGSGVRR